MWNCWSKDIRTLPKGIQGERNPCLDNKCGEADPFFQAVDIAEIINP
jgi:hypothetical protein